MQEQEIIIVNGIPAKTYEAIIEKAVRYAIISVAFTFNRLGIDELEQKIINIAKGKTAEFVFRYFCWGNGIPADFEICSTPFYQNDKRDFVLENYEWDLKNNFIYHKGDLLPAETEYIQLPALIPDDQWVKRDKTDVKGVNGVKYLFTFLKNFDTYQKNRNFIQLNLSSDQKKKLYDVYQQYAQKKNITEAPFTEDEFWNHLNLPKNFFSVIHFPHLIITAYAGEEHWHLFANSGSGLKTYCELMTTKLNNRFTEIKHLPSFLSLILDYYMK